MLTDEDLRLQASRLGLILLWAGDHEHIPRYTTCKVVGKADLVGLPPR
jgi:hypothetical protein